MSWYNDDQVMARQRAELEEKRAALGQIAELMQKAKEGLLEDVQRIVNLVRDNNLGQMTDIPDWQDEDTIEVGDYVFNEVVEKIFDSQTVIDTAEQWASSHHCN